MRKTPIALSGERGSSMLAVIGLMAVAGVATLAIAGSTMNSVGVSSATRAGVQAQSAAEAGIDAALLTLTTNTCTAAGWGVINPVAAVSVSYSTSTASDDWVAGCPISTAVRVKILATGSASDVGVAGNTTGDRATVEAIYAYESATAATPATGAGTALYSYAFGDFGGSSQLHWVDNPVVTDVPINQSDSRPLVQVKTGDAECGGSSIFEADIVVEDGNFESGESCKIVGNVWASDDADTGGSSILYGNLVSTDLTASGSSQIYGSVWAAGTSTVAAGIWIHTDLITRQFPGIASRVKGSVTVAPGGIGSVAPAAPEAPTVPDWVDVGYDLADWPGFEVSTMGHGCKLADIQEAANLFTGPGIIDARDCPQGVFLKENTVHLSLPNDLAIFASRFKIGLDAQIDAPGATDRKLWLITPDETADGLPTCRNASGNSDVTQSFIVQAPVSAMLYSPCSIDLSFSAQWRGQFYGGTVSTGGSSQLHYTGVGIPGTDITAGGTPGNDATEAKLGDRISIRDLNG
jgi:Tfp pilus assembly major pilin PilA